MSKPNDSVYEEFIDDFLDSIDHARLTDSEKRELLRIAKGVSPRESGLEEELSYETIRARRKSILMKLGMARTLKLQSRMLAYSLRRITEPQYVRRLS